jgi:Raf kinase inhibitor-like YbhB/YbcL family protein
VEATPIPAMVHPLDPARGSHRARQEGLDPGLRSDPYRDEAHWPDPCRCPDCGAVYHQGRWQWAEALRVEPQRQRCPACRRLQDRQPAAALHLHGQTLDARWPEMQRLVQHMAEREGNEHPLERIMDIHHPPLAPAGERQLTFTGTHLAHGVASALQQAYGGQLQARYPEGDTMLRIDLRLGDGPARPQLLLTSPSFAEGETIPRRHTAGGRNLSPALHWSGEPQGTASYVLIFDDPDAGAVPWLHWLLYDIPAGVHHLPEGLEPAPELANGARHGRCWGVSQHSRSGYQGPQPPPGPPHRYRLRLLALDRRLGLPAGAGLAMVEEAMAGHVLAEASLSGTLADGTARRSGTSDSLTIGADVAAAVVADPAAIRDSVRRITLQALAEGHLDREAIRALLAAVVAAASTAAPVASDSRRALRDAVAGVEAALAVAAEALLLALQEAAGRSGSFSRSFLRGRQHDLGLLEGMFLEALQQGGQDAAGFVNQTLLDLADHGRRSGTAVGERVRQGWDDLSRALADRLDDRLEQGVDALQHQQLLLAAIVSGVIEGLMDRLAAAQ